MKKILALMILMIGLVVFPPGPTSAMSIDHGKSFVTDVGHVAPVAMIQEEGGVPPANDPGNVTATETGGNFFTNNLGALVLGLLAFVELIVRLTPSEKDNSIFNWIAMLINALLPNLKKGGGTFKVSSN